MQTLAIQTDKTIIERKVCFDSTTVDHICKLLKVEQEKIMLFHEIETSFTMKTDQVELTIPKGSCTIASYWTDKPYNFYFWIDKEGNYLGSYFNIVRNTVVTDEVVSFEDLIIDILVLPNGDCFILDEEELPESLEQFEQGFVKIVLVSLLDTVDMLIENVKIQTEELLQNMLRMQMEDEQKRKG
ncbi:putative RNA-binding protein associated with RNAse of E/G family [Sporosarcina luteola]|nr:putative RNA-binding protein associated with RNAse of E/G family [Sporosarcina luteola]